jgi:hypothetical protein
MPSLSGKYLPTSLWNSSTLHLPSHLAIAHKEFLEEHGWWASYDPTASGGIGGISTAEAQEHVTNRFLNSAARMQFVCSDPNDEDILVREMVLDQLADGQIYLLDLAAGNGSGTLALLSLICELRAHECIPKLPLNVSISGVDYSVDALGYYADLLGRLDPWLVSNGININLTLHNCDLSISGDFSEVLESFFKDADRGEIKRFLCVVSALSGAKKDGIAHLLDSLKLAAAALSHRKRNSSWLWVEPHVGKTWLTKAIDTVKLTLQKVAHVFSSKGESFEIVTSATTLEEKPKRSFKWIDPHKGTSTMSHVFVAGFKNE